MPSVEDYHALLARAASALTKDGSEGRQELYNRARAALKAEFKKLDEPQSGAAFFEEQRKLDVAIFDFEFSSSTSELTNARAA
jgi:hypothetical protein